MYKQLLNNVYLVFGAGDILVCRCDSLCTEFGICLSVAGPQEVPWVQHLHIHVLIKQFYFTGNGAAFTKLFERLIRGVWTPTAMEFMQPSL